MNVEIMEQQIRERLKAATPGPWSWYSADCGCQFVRHNDGSESGGEFVTSLDNNVRGANTKLIANAPADLAYLLDALDAERKEVRELQKAGKIIVAAADRYFDSAVQLEAELVAARERERGLREALMKIIALEDRYEQEKVEHARQHGRSHFDYADDYELHARSIVAGEAAEIALDAIRKGNNDGR